MNLAQWAIKWGIPYEAVEDLRREFGLVNTDPIPQEGQSEAAVQVRVRLEANAKDMRLWRNNVGGLRTETGGFVRYGLANDTEEMNDRIKSADLIGIRRIQIEPRHLGSCLGQFVARETKPEAWRWSGTEHEQAQLKFLELVASLGGDAAFATGEGTL